MNRYVGDRQKAIPAQYIAHRLERATGKQSVFASEALAILYEVTNGQLRDIDRLATACL